MLAPSPSLAASYWTASVFLHFDKKGIPLNPEDQKRFSERYYHCVGVDLVQGGLFVVL